MFDNSLRKIKDSILSFFTRSLLDHLRPNYVTTAAFAAGLAVPFALFHNKIRMALVFWFLNRILDGMDGLAARHRNMQSDFGGYYDIMTDFVIYASIPISLALRENSQDLYRATLLLLGTFYINAASWMFLSGLLEKRNISSPRQRDTTLTMPQGIIEGTETILFYTLFMVFPAHLIYFMSAMSLLTGAGIIQRLLYAHKVLNA